MRSRLRRYWPALKAVLAAAILFTIGRQFWRDLQEPELWRRPLHPGWLLLSALLYLLWMGSSALYWYRLLGHLGQRPPAGAALRAYYVGHLGKYLPGKAWALFLRASLIRGGGVRLGLATLTSLYEVLTTMASGALVAVVLFALLAPDTGVTLDRATLRRLLQLQAPAATVLERWVAVPLALLLLVPLLLVLLPPAFNRLVHHLALPFREQEAARLPPIRLGYLVEGLLLTAVGWLVLGASLGAALCGILGPDLAWSAEGAGRLPAIIGLSYVAGFVILVAPGGLGVREFFLRLFLTPELLAMGLLTKNAEGTAALTALVLRLVWTLAELPLAAVLYKLPQRSSVSSQKSEVLGPKSEVLGPKSEIRGQRSAQGGVQGEGGGTGDGLRSADG
jgi:uncharacterized membrane protein YbhN (UPF0104 family)